MATVVNGSKINNSSVYVINDSSSKEVIFIFDTIQEVSFKASSNVTSYPTELGINVTDYKYDNPDEIEVVGILNNASKEKQLEKIKTQLNHYKSGIYKLDIQTKAGLRQGYTLSGYEIPENIDNYSQFVVNMSFTQVKTFNNYDPSSNSDSDTQQVGSMEVSNETSN